MGDIVDLNQFKQKKENKLSEKNYREEIPELSEEDFEEFLEYEKEIGLPFNDYDIYGDNFIKKNADHIAHHTIPHCTVCDSYLEDGDRVDSMWPLEYGHNVCKDCQSRMPKKIKMKKIVNLNKIKLVIVDEDYKKIEKYLNEEDIYNIKGHRIVTESGYEKVKYHVLNNDDNDMFTLP
jgi:hypothetical protein